MTTVYSRGGANLIKTQEQRGKYFGILLCTLGCKFTRKSNLAGKEIRKGVIWAGEVFSKLIKI